MDTYRRDTFAVIIVSFSWILCAFCWNLPSATATQSTDERWVHRRIQDDHDSSCPGDSIWHCDNPDLVRSDDPTVGCDKETCEWYIDWLDPDNKPLVCQGIVILLSSIAFLPNELEPCLLWELEHGHSGLTTARALEAFTDDFLTPFASPHTTTTPTALASTISPLPTPFESSASSLEPATEDPITSNSVEFDTVLVSYFVLPGALRRQRRLAAQFDLVALQETTSVHIQRELDALYGQDGFVEQVDVLLVLADSTQLDDGAIVVTYAINGVVTVADVDLIQANSVSRLIRKSFDDEPLQRYLGLLKASDDPVLQQTYQLYVGLPSDLNLEGANPTSGNDQDASNESEKDKLLDFEWSALWIAVFAGAGFGIILLSAILIYLCCCRNTTSRLQHSKSGGTVPSSRNDVDPTDPTGYDNSSFTDRGVPQDTSDDCAGSETTSVYSYVDSGTVIDSIVDDQNYSIAPSYMHGIHTSLKDNQRFKNAYEDDDDEDIETVQSRHGMWSVIDGIEDGNMIDANIVNENTPSVSSTSSPSRMVVTTERSKKANGEFLIFSDEDEDDLSLVSEHYKLQIAQTRSVCSAKSSLGLGGESKIGESWPDDEEESEMSGRRLPFTNSDSPSQKSLVSSPGSKLTLSAASVSKEQRSWKTTGTPESHISTAASSSDDDSSIFLGADSSLANRLTNDKSILQLRPEHSVRSVRDGPIGHRTQGLSNGTILSPKEKAQLGWNASRSLPDDGNSDSDSDIESVLIPENYKMNPEPIAGPNDYPLESMASF